MICEKCQRRPAVYHVTRIVDGDTVEQVHLCEQCAAEQGELNLPADPHFTVQQFLASLMGIAGPEAGVAEAVPDTRCPHCGLSYGEFAKTGLLGCPECYDAFSEQLEPLVHRIQGQGRHAGKLPKRVGGALVQRRLLEEMRRELAAAVHEERFERAAELRDQIRALEAEQPETTDPRKEGR